jgi:hypothetical protein
MANRSVASVFIDEASEKRPTRKGEFLSELNEAKGDAFVVVRSDAAESMRDTSKASALDNNANNLSRKKLRELRASRYERRYGLWKISSLQRVRDCGRKKITKMAGIKLVGGTATFSGLATCGSVWCCPVCAAKIMASRSKDVKAAIDLWGLQNKSFIFQTLTMRHHKGQSLEELWQGLSFAWQRLNSGGAAKAEAAKYAQAGFIRVVELTYGSNGWHIHIHILRFLETPPSEIQVKEWSNAQFERWSKALTAKGLATPMRDAQDFKLTRNAEDLAKYLTKQAHYGGKLGMELTSAETKKAKRGGRKPFEVLDDAIGTPHGNDRRLWEEYEQASRGKKQTHWSNGLRTMLGIDYDKSDEEIAISEADQVKETVPIVCLSNKGIRLLTSNKKWQHEALTITERLGEEGLKDYLDDRGIEWQTPQEIIDEDEKYKDDSGDDYFTMASLLRDFRQH